LAGERVNLLGLPRAELEAFVATRLGAKPFRARQLMKWIYRRGAADFAAMTDLSQDFRSQLDAAARIAVPEIVAEQASHVIARPLSRGFAWQLVWKGVPPAGQQAWEFQNAAIRAYKRLASIAE